MNFKKISIEIKNEFIDIIYDSYSKKFYTYEDEKHWSYIEGDHIKSHIFKTRDEVTTPNQTNTGGCIKKELLAILQLQL